LIQRLKVAQLEEVLQFARLNLLLGWRLNFLLNLHVQRTQRYPEHMRQILIVLATLKFIGERIDGLLTVQY
jgi:hypothetical protein